MKKEVVVFRYGDIQNNTEKLSMTMWTILRSSQVILPSEYVVLITDQHWYYPQDMPDDREEFKNELVAWLDEQRIWWDKMKYIKRVGKAVTLMFLLDSEDAAALVKLKYC